MPVEPELTQVERDKLEIDPDIDFRRIAQTPFQALTPNEIGMFKWSGVYHQLQTGFFMIRLRMPGGFLTADQLEKAAELARTLAQDQLCITTRQCLQFHWVRKEDIYKVIEGMQAVGVLTRNACGDVTRNVVSCSLQGVCPHEIGNSREMLQKIADHPELLDEQRNLPRKHKISVAGCGRACGQTLMNCQGWHPVTRSGANGEAEVGWKFHAGGGLGARPFTGKAIFDWVPADRVVDVAAATVELFRRKGDRRVRAKARLKIIVDAMGPAAFGQAVMDVMKERGVSGLNRIEPSVNPASVGRSFLDGQAVIPQRQAGFNVVRIMIPRSELTSEEACRFASLAREFGNGTIMFTNRQNLELRFVPDEKVKPLLAQIHEAGYRTEGHERLEDMVACVGTTLCNMAVGDTPDMYWELKKALEAEPEISRSVGTFKINMNGCPNACGHSWIADIGLRGERRRGEGTSKEGFAITVGGRLHGEGRMGAPLCRVAKDDTVAVILKILRIYLAGRTGRDETFSDYVERVGVEALQGKVKEARNNEE